LLVQCHDSNDAVLNHFNRHIVCINFVGDDGWLAVAVTIIRCQWQAWAWRWPWRNIKRPTKVGAHDDPPGLRGTSAPTAHAQHHNCNHHSHAHH
jgi:hypothetical protein